MVHIQRHSVDLFHLERASFGHCCNAVVAASVDVEIACIGDQVHFDDSSRRNEGVEMLREKC